MAATASGSGIAKDDPDGFHSNGDDHEEEAADSASAAASVPVTGAAAFCVCATRQVVSAGAASGLALARSRFLSAACCRNVRIFLREELRIAARRRAFRILLAAERRQQPAGPAALDRIERGRELRNGVGLQMVRVIERAQVRDQLVLVARRHQRAQQQDIGDRGAHRVHRGLARIDDGDVGQDFLPDDALDDGGLPEVRLDGEHEGLRH